MLKCQLFTPPRVAQSSSSFIPCPRYTSRLANPVLRPACLAQGPWVHFLAAAWSSMCRRGLGPSSLLTTSLPRSGTRQSGCETERGGGWRERGGTRAARAEPSRSWGWSTVMSTVYHVSDAHANTCAHVQPSMSTSTAARTHAVPISVSVCIHGMPSSRASRREEQSSLARSITQHRRAETSLPLPAAPRRTSPGGRAQLGG